MQSSPQVVGKNGWNHDGKCADTEPRASVDFWEPLERWLAKQSPEEKSQRRDKGLSIYGQRLLICVTEINLCSAACWTEVISSLSIPLLSNF